MRRKSFCTISLAVLMAGSLMLGGCSSSTASSSSGSTSTSDSSDKVYTIAMDMDYAPFEYQENNKWVGIDVDLLSAIAEASGFKYEEKHMNFNGIIPALQANQVDASLAAMFITDERKEVVDFSDPYYSSGLGAFVNVDNNDIKSVDDFNGKTVAAKKGETGAAWAEANKEKYNLTVQYYDDTATTMQAVKQGNADIGLTDFSVIGYYINIDENAGVKLIDNYKLDETPLGFAVKKGTNQELLQKFNEGLKTIVDNGTFDKIVAKYVKN